MTDVSDYRKDQIFEARVALTTARLRCQQVVWSLEHIDELSRREVAQQLGLNRRELRRLMKPVYANTDVWRATLPPGARMMMERIAS